MRGTSLAATIFFHKSLLSRSSVVNMNFNDYQTKSRKTAGYPAIGHPVITPTLGRVN